MNSLVSSKRIVSIALISALGSTAVAIRPQPAHAMAVGVNFAEFQNTAAAVAAFVGGLVVFYGGIASGVYLMQSDYTWGALGSPLFCLSIIGGIALTDDPSGEVSLGNLAMMTDETARQYGISPETMAILRDSRDELDAVSQESLEEFARAKKSDVQAARAAWERYLPTLDRETQDAVRDAFTQLALHSNPQRN